MRTYQLDKLGDLSGIVEPHREAPTPGPHDIVIRVRAMSLNKRDLFILNGSSPRCVRSGCTARSCC